MKTGRKSLSIIMTLMMVLSMFSGLTFSAYADTGSAVWDGSSNTSWYGDGSASEYSLSDGADLAGFAELVNEGNTFEGKTVSLTDDIYLNSDAAPTANAWTPIAQVVAEMQNGNPDAKDESEQHPFKGTFDGTGHYIYNLYINGYYATDPNPVGNALFGYNMGTVKNIGVTGATYSFRRDAGIAGINKGTISECYSDVSVNGNGRGDNRGSGGIVGTNYGTVQNCINRGNVKNSAYAGGIVGFNDGGNIVSCYNVGNITSDYRGGIAGSNEQNHSSSKGTVSNCYYLEGSCATGVYNTEDSAETASAFGNDGKLISDSSKTLLDALNAQSGAKFMNPASGVYPVLSWQKNFAWDDCTVVVSKPQGTDFTVTYNDGSEDREITSSEKVNPGTELTLTVNNIAEDRIFGGFTEKDSSGKEKNLGGITKNAPYTVSYTVQSDVELSASIVSKSDTALTVYRQMGDAGKKVKVKDISWNDLMADADANASKYGYLYYKGGWIVLGGDGLTTLDSILNRAGIIPADTDQIVASDPTGYETAAAYSILKTSQDQYKFYPQAGGNLDSDEGALVVPAGVAYSWNSVSLSGQVKAEDALASAVAVSYIDPAGMRFVYGTNEADFNAKSGTSAAGKRLAKGVTEIIIRTAVSSDSFPGIADITAAELSDGSDRAPYDSYTAAYDAATGTVNVTASGLNSYVNAAAPADGSGYWAGLSIPVGFAAADQIKIGTNFSDMTTVNASLVANGKVSFYWNSFNNDLTNILISTDGGNTVYNIPVKCAISQSVFNFAGIELTMEQLKKYETTAEFTCTKKGNVYTYAVTGIKVSDIIKNYASDVKAAAIKFSEVGNGFSGTAENYQYNWDDAMVIWKKIDTSSGKEESLGGTGLSSAVNGSGGNLWVTNLASASYTAADFSLDGRYVTKAQLAGNDDENVTTETFLMNGNEKTVTGVKISKLVEKGIIREMPATVTFASGSYAQTAAQCDYNWDNVMITWNDDDQNVSLTAAVNGSKGNLWVGGIDTVTTEKSVFEVSVDGVSKYLSMKQLKAHETSKDMSMQTKAGTSTYKVTGITMSDMIDNYLGKGTYTNTLASLTFYEAVSSGKSPSEVYNRDHSWDDVMVIWSQIDSSNTEKISAGKLKEAVDGAGGMFWWDGIVGMNAVRADFLIDGVGFTSDQISDSATTAQFTMNSKTPKVLEVTGVTVKDLAENYLNGVEPKQIKTFENKTETETDVTIGTADGEYASDKVMLAWQEGSGENIQAEEPLRLAVDNAPGKLWWSKIYSVKNVYSVSFKTTPEDAAITVTDSENGDAVVEPESDGTYLLEGGHSYSYKATCSGYTPKSGGINIILGAGAGIIDVALNKSSSGGSGGSSGGNTGTTDPADKPGAILTIYTQEGKDGAKKAAAAFTKDELFGLSTTNRSGYVYQYYRNQIWSAVVATRVVKFDDLLSDAGVSFTSKDSMRQDASKDGFNTTLTYKQINENRYFFDPANNGEMSEVPAGIALEWEQGDIEDGYADVAAKAFYSGSLRYVVGTTESLYKGTGGLSNDREYAPGYRLGSNIDSITIIKNAEISDTSGRVTGGGTNSGTPEETKPEDKDVADVKTTTDAKTGAVTEVTTYKDGSVKTVVTEKDGSVKTTIENKDGTGSTTTADASGVSKSDVNIAPVAADAAKSGKTVSLPMTSVKATDDAANTSTVTVKTGTTSNVKVEIPVSDMNEGVVAVIVGKDGTEKVITNAVSSSNGIVVSVADGDQIKLVNKAGKFSDVASGNWAEGPVAFVTSRDIFNGTGNGKFSPSAPMTRAMLMTVLARIDGADTTAAASGNWYDKGLAWAVEKKVSDGSAPMSSISREQLVTMLYRYAGQPAVTDGSLSSFSDASSVSDYAKTAMTWAVKNGIINGMDGKIAPKSNATRAQVAAMIQRYIKATA